MPSYSSVEKRKKSRRSRKRLSPAAMEAGQESTFAKVLHGAQTSLYITAGLVDEMIKREQGKRPTAYHEILRESGANLIPWLSDERRRVTYGDFVSTPGLGFALDILGDPITYVPYAGATKAVKGIGFVGKVVTRTPLKFTIGQVDKALGTQALKHLEDLADGIRRRFIPHYDLKRIGGKELLRVKEKQYRDLGESLNNIQGEIDEGIRKLLPDQASQAKIFDLIERRPILPKGRARRVSSGEGLRDDPNFQSWADEVRNLTPNEKEAFKAGTRIQQQLEDLKKAAGVLSSEQAEGFRKKFGIQYLPHMRGTARYMREQANDLLDGIRKGDPTSIERAKTIQLPNGKMIGDAKDGLKKVEDSLLKTIDELDTMPRMDEALLTKVRDEAKFLKPRHTPGTAKSIGDVNMDLAYVLGVEGAQVAHAVAARTHANTLLRFVRSKGYMFDEEPDLATLTKLFGKSKAENLMRDGFEKLSAFGLPKPLKELGGKLIPKTLAKEIAPAFKAYTSQRELSKFLTVYKDVQNIWKAWTLSIFPAYHTRNFISNLWNNFLAGMGPTAGKHYWRATHLMTDMKRGTLSIEDAKLIKEATKMRVLDAGLYSGAEVGNLFDAQPLAGKLLKRLYHPAHNPVLRKTFSWGRGVEDHARLSHYLWARNFKGLSRADAAASVNKYLFDYKYGLTPFERTAFRDFVAPFYSWSRFNLPLQLEMMATKPGRFVTMPKLIREYERVQEQLSDEYGAPKPNEIFMADWMKRSTKVKLRWNKDKDAYEYFLLDNWLPSAEVGRLFNSGATRDMLVGLLSPFTKLPFEIIWNFNSFRKRKIREYPGQKKKLLGVPLDPSIEHAARSIRLLNEADRVIEGIFREEGELGKLTAILRVVTGKAYPYRPEKQKDWWVWQTNKRISDLKRSRKYAEKRGDAREVSVLDGLIEELETERDYFKKVKVK